MLAHVLCVLLGHVEHRFETLHVHSFWSLCRNSLAVMNAVCSLLVEIEDKGSLL